MSQYLWKLPVKQDPPAVRERIANALDAHQSAGLWRVQQARASLHQPHIVYDKQPLLNFNSNDYLGMSTHPVLAEALMEGALRFGAGASSANTLSGYTTAHESLIETIKDWLGVEDVLLFSSGYIANLAVLSTLPDIDEHIYLDRYSHASLLDGACMSKATFRRYPHQRLDILKTWLKGSGNWIVTESLFGMNGDKTEINTLLELSENQQAMLYIDEAHALGVYGEQGCGLIGSMDIPLRLGTFSKALGLQGAFVAGDQDLIAYCRQFARPYLFTTALSPAIAYAAQRSIEIVRKADQQRSHVQALIAYFKQHMTRLGIETGSDTLIQPIYLKDCELSNRMAAFLREKGICVSSIRYPTVPKDKPRIRVSLTAQHRVEDIDTFASALQEAYDVL